MTINTPPPHIQEVFTTLGKGHRLFVSNNGDESEKELYNWIDQHLQGYNEYLQAIGFVIHQGNGFYYMSSESAEGNTQVDEKMKRVLHWIQVFHFLSSIFDGFDSGTPVLASEIEKECTHSNDQAEVLKKLVGTSEGSSIREQVDSLMGRLLKVGFLREASAIERQYVALSSTNYIKEFIERITIEGEK